MTSQTAALAIADLDLPAVAALLDDLHAATPRATARRADARDAQRLVDGVRRAVSAAAEDDRFAEVYVHAGFVPSSYRGTAEADRLSATLSLIHI